MSDQKDIHERAVRALQEHGFLFQKRCVEEIRPLCRYRIESEEYPVLLGTEDNVIDFIVRMLDTGRTYIVFECKRAHPDYVSWVFPVCPVIPAPEPRFLLTSVALESSNPLSVSVRTHQSPIIGGDSFHTSDMGLEFSADAPRRGKSSKTDTIYAACKQVMTGIGGLVLERKKQMPTNVFQTLFYIPVVITSADLFVTRYRPSDVDLKTGDIVLDKARTDAVDWVTYDFPVPEQLQVTPPGDSRTTLVGPDDMYRRLIKVKSIAIVRSTCIAKFLGLLRSPD